MIWIALVFVIGQAVTIATLLVFVRRFGQWTEAIIHTHDSNILIHHQNIKVLDEIRILRNAQEKGKVA